tara:strand:- start:266 stop:505 length:240 start_codon:yes stop_codon:yes gene_type:complete
MKDFKNIAVAIDSAELSPKEIVLLIELLGNKIDINTISGMARSEKKTPKGIRYSKRYLKINIGDALLCAKGAKDISLPF